ncbi:MAG: HD domain-containing protein [Clostridia bacterium]|nr:HD domain-containing protein [Clostridia bacterium]
MNFKPIDNSGRVDGYALVMSCEKKTSKTSSHYLDIKLQDKTGEISAKSWDFREGDFCPEPNSIIKIRGVLSEYNGNPQLKIEKMRLPEEGEVNEADFIPTAEYASKYMMDELRARVSGFKDNNLRLIVNYILDKYGDDMLGCPAAFKLHHAIRGGLLMHTLSIVRLCDAVISLYPSVDGELLVAGAILHDVCKTDEFNLAKSGMVSGYSMEGQLLGHLVMGAMEVEKAGKETGADYETTVLLEHMLISHHGEPEFGVAVRPCTLEAEILSQLDNLDAKIYEIEDALKNVEPGGFSNKLWALNDRKFYNHGRKEVAPKVDFGDN